MNLLFSELGLIDIPRRKFHLHSWTTGDEFMRFSTHLLSNILLDLIDKKIFEISIEYRDIKLFKTKLYTQKTASIILKAHSVESIVIGWIENEFLNIINKENPLPADNLFGELLRSIFPNNAKFINPGKVLVYQILKNQKLQLFEFQEKKSFLSPLISVSLTLSNDSFSNNLIFERKKSNTPAEYKEIIYKVVKKEFSRFQNLD